MRCLTLFFLAFNRAIFFQFEMRINRAHGLALLECGDIARTDAQDLCCRAR